MFRCLDAGNKEAPNAQLTGIQNLNRLAKFDPPYRLMRPRDLFGPPRAPERSVITCPWFSSAEDSAIAAAQANKGRSKQRMASLRATEPTDTLRQVERIDPGTPELSPRFSGSRDEPEQPPGLRETLPRRRIRVSGQNYGESAQDSLGSMCSSAIR